jgi:regulatory protein PHO2
MPNESYLINDVRNRRIALQIDPSPFTTEEDEDDIPDSAVSSSSSIYRSPSSSPTAPRPWSGNDVDGHKSSAAGPHRVRSTALPGGKNEKEKRKRSRVTPDQLVHLEQFFAVERSPTAARRREISELLGMQERQTQIWFQNRYSLSLFLSTPLYLLN